MREALAPEAKERRVGLGMARRIAGRMELVESENSALPGVRCGDRLRLPDPRSFSMGPVESRATNSFVIISQRTKIPTECLAIEFEHR